MVVYLPDGSFFDEVSACLSNKVRESALDRLVVKGTCGLEAIVPIVKTKSDDPTQVVINSDPNDDWHLTLTVNTKRTFFWEDGGSLREEFDGDLIDKIANASSNANLDQLLDALVELLGDANLEVEITWSTPVDILGAHYIETVDLFVEKALGDEWHIFARQLVDKTSCLIIGDLKGRIGCRGYEILGHGMGASRGALDARLNSSLASDGRPSLPHPTRFAPMPHVPRVPTRDRLLEVLNGITNALSWYWIANAITLDSRLITLHFSGSRVVQIRNHHPIKAQSAMDEILLADWAFASDDPARLEAVRSAAALALADDTIFDQAAAAVLRTAESLFQLARREVIAEALATRRTVRQAAISAANDAAKSGREASTKAVERSAVQIAAVLAIVVANIKDFVNLLVAIVVLLVISLVSIVSWLVSKNVDLRAAKDTLDNFIEDLEEYQDTLSENDLQHLRQLRSITSAQEHLKRSAKVVRWLVIGVETVLIGTVLILVLAFLVRREADTSRHPDAPGNSSSTVAPTASATSPGANVAQVTTANLWAESYYSNLDEGAGARRHLWAAGALQGDSRRVGGGRAAHRLPDQVPHEVAR